MRGGGKKAKYTDRIICGAEDLPWFVRAGGKKGVAKRGKGDTLDCS